VGRPAERQTQPPLLGNMADTEGVLCNVCLAGNPGDLVEPINTNCGHLMCWPCIYRAVRDSNQPKCPVCRTEVVTVTPLYGMGRLRNHYHLDTPLRPHASDSDPFESLSFGNSGPPRRSTRHRTTNRRLNDYHVPTVSEPTEQPVSEAIGTSRAGDRGTGLSRELETSVSQSAASAEVREVDNPAATSQNNLANETDEMVADFSDDEDEESRRVEEQSNQRISRFQIKQLIPGLEISHLQAVVMTVEHQMVSNQIKLNEINWMEVARQVRAAYLTSFPRTGSGSEAKKNKAISSLCSNALRKAVKNFKKKMAILGRTGNSGPPDTNLEQSLRTIITIDQSPSEATRITRPGRRSTRPFISNPQPISTNTTPDPRSRSPLSARERSEAATLLGLDNPGTYRQERTRLSNEGANLREESLAEMHPRRRSSTASVRSAGQAAILGVSSTIDTVASQKSNVEMLILNNMDARRQEREEDKEERRRMAAMEKMEREAKEKNEKVERDRKEKKEKEEREHRELKEERRMAMEREEKERKDLIMLKLIGLDTKPKKKTIKVVSVSEDPNSQPLPTKLVLTSIQALKKDLCEYMGESEIAGIIVQDEDGDCYIQTNIEQLMEGGGEKFKVTKVDKRGKLYYKLVEY